MASKNVSTLHSFWPYFRLPLHSFTLQGKASFEGSVHGFPPPDGAGLSHDRNLTLSP